MNWQSFSSKIQKIKILAENAEKDGQVSRLERDLLASYVRDLYDLIMDDGSLSQPQATYKKEVVTPEPVVKKQEPVHTPEPVRIVESPVVKETKTEVVEVPDVHKEIPVAEVAPVIVETPVAPPQPVVQEVQTPVQQVVTPPVSNVNIDPTLLAELFTEEKVTDLSDKLASQKIPDLTKAMGINEKIFTIQELFNNDNQLFNETIQQLNGLPDFQAAKMYMTQHVIQKLDWTSDKKLKKAATFIKLVRRRYM
jgi:hypothetical protein